MFSYDQGWMRGWRPDGEFRVRFSPRPCCEQWRPSLGNWLAVEPEDLWIREAERFENRQRRRKPDSRQLELPGMSVQESTVSPPRTDPGLPASRLWGEVPGEWRELLAPVRIHPWRGLLFLSELGGPAEDLFASNPGLAWLLSARLLRGTAEERKEAVRQLGRDLRHRQRDLLEVLELPSKPWMVKLVRKLQFDQVPAHCIQRLRCIDRHEPLRRIFQHTERLTAPVWRMVAAETADLMTWDLVEELNGMPEYDLRLEMIEENLRDVGILAQRGEKVPRFKSTLELEQWRWQRDAALGLHAGTKRREPEVYPPAPFPGTSTILPIPTRRLLREEGKRMSHCVATYHKEAWTGRVAIYAVFQPERATLGLRKNPDGSWRVFDFRCRGNRSPTRETRRAVREWLRPHGVQFV